MEGDLIMLVNIRHSSDLCEKKITHSEDDFQGGKCIRVIFLSLWMQNVVLSFRMYHTNIFLLTPGIYLPYHKKGKKKMVFFTNITSHDL